MTESTPQQKIQIEICSVDCDDRMCKVERNKGREKKHEWTWTTQFDVRASAKTLFIQKKKHKHTQLNRVYSYQKRKKKEKTNEREKRLQFHSEMLMMIVKPMFSLINSFASCLLFIRQTNCGDNCRRWQSTTNRQICTESKEIEMNHSLCMQLANGHCVHSK